MNYDKSMRIFLLLVSLCVSCPLLAKDAYRTLDEHGNVIYTDTPVEGSEKIRLDEVQTVNPGDVPEFSYTPPPAAVDNYSRLEIVSPANDSVIQAEEEGSVSVSAVLEPALNYRAGHYIVLNLDGNQVASGAGLQFTLGDLERGTHTLELYVMDQSGSVLISSPVVSFTIYQHSIRHKESTVGKPPKKPPPP